MKIKITPGPWKVEHNGAWPSIVCRNGGKEDGATICTEVCNGEDNAEMIAKLPELLAFYREVCNLTLNHAVEHSDMGPTAVVYPRDLGEALSKVNPEWYKDASSNPTILAI